VGIRDALDIAEADASSKQCVRIGVSAWAETCRRVGVGRAYRRIGVSAWAERIGVSAYRRIGVGVRSQRFAFSG
jgi:hypothetical protein